MRTEIPITNCSVGCLSRRDQNAGVIFMLDAVENTAKWTTEKICAIEALMEEAARHIKEAHPMIYSHELIQLLFAQAKYHREVTRFGQHDVASRSTASRYLKRSCDNEF